MSKRITRRFLVLLLGVLLLQGSGVAAGAVRKVKTKVAPTYPEMAKQMRVAGTVRIEAVIGADGSIKSTKALGGHPLLIQSATDALKQWRYEPGPETTAIIEFHFEHAN